MKQDLSNKYMEFLRLRTCWKTLHNQNELDRTNITVLGMGETCWNDSGHFGTFEGNVMYTSSFNGLESCNGFPAWELRNTFLLIRFMSFANPTRYDQFKNLRFLSPNDVDLEKLRPFPLYSHCGTWKNSGFSSYKRLGADV